MRLLRSFQHYAGGDSVRKHLFEHFWTSGSPLIGEEGGDGWQQWAAQQHQQGQPALPPEEPGVKSAKLLLMQACSRPFGPSYLQYP